MGNCLTSSPKHQQPSELTINVALSGLPPLAVSVRPADTLGQVRDKVRAKIAARDVPNANIQGAAMTMRGGSGGDAVRIPDTTTVKKARLENRQTIWFSDEAHERDVVLRASILTANVASNSRGVKRGMKMLGRG